MLKKKLQKQTNRFKKGFSGIVTLYLKTARIRKPLSPFFRKKRVRIPLGVLAVLLVLFIFCLPEPLFENPYSTVLNDKNGILLSAKIADDGQWRFPLIDTLPQKFKTAIVLFEDEHFYSHPGVNPFAVFRALRNNIRAGEIVQGGSTISMQVIRMSRGNKRRNIWQKIIESFLSLRLETRYSKNEILKFYASHAPFGGNVVGLEAASWRYYGRSPDKLSWAETATLAVLPNAPSLIYPGKNQEALRLKRNRLLDKIRDKGIIDSLSCELAKLEPLPQKPKALPQLTPHLLDRCFKEGQNGKRINTTIDYNIQQKCNQIIDRHFKLLSVNEIRNAAVMVVKVKTGEVVAYVGNTNDTISHSGRHVDIITSKRSSGSILKPLLYAFMLNDGIITPNSLIPDIPTRYEGFAPKNFSQKYDGAVPAGNALARSLNIPATRMLHQYGVEKFHRKLQRLNFKTINRPPDHYGLTLILGGAEIRLWDLARVYSAMARTLANFGENSSTYRVGNYFEPYFDKSLKPDLPNRFNDRDILSASSIWLTFEALTDMDRPEEGANWDLFGSAQKIAWKTGTSFGHRDAWTAGITPEYVVISWVGNADGEGRPGLTGATVAAPIMFDVFDILPETSWFSPPYDDLKQIEVCKKSGFKAGPNCEETELIYSTEASDYSKSCPYHQKVILDKDKHYQVNSNCYPVKDMVIKSWFVLPTVMEWYYRKKNPFYKKLPPVRSDCKSNKAANLELIYPTANAKIYIPFDFGGIRGRTVFEAIHRLPEMEIHWHLDEKYLGSTIGNHQMEIYATEGLHTITLAANDGEMVSCKFEILKRQNTTH